MTKRIMALALAALLSFSMLAACGDKTPAVTDPAASDPAVSGSTDANGGADETKGTLIIGGIGPLTGAAAVYGINVKNGAQIAVDERTLRCSCSRCTGGQHVPADPLGLGR